MIAFEHHLFIQNPRGNRLAPAAQRRTSVAQTHRSAAATRRSTEVSKTVATAHLVNASPPEEYSYKKLLKQFSKRAF